MKKILHIISSPRGEASFSIKLGKAIIEKIQAANPGSTLKVHDLTNSPFPHLEEVHLKSFFTPAESRTPELVAAVKHSEEAISELIDADIIVIGAPLYNFSIPSTLKTWIDHICRAGITFKYDANGAEGLIKGKKIYIALSSGGIYSEGPMQEMDYAVPYLKNMLSFLGMADITVVRVEGTSIPGIQNDALQKGIDSVQIN